jgi:Histidine kinase-, DNA gyrase B-, and HSP90-like ATPase.
VSRQHCRIHLAPDYANLLLLEDFIFGCPFLDESERNRAVLIVTEYFDNIISHSYSRFHCDIAISVHKDKQVRIVIRYYTHNFSEMLKAERVTLPHFDSKSDRYRGLGLRMCRNLASEIRYRKGLFKSFIIITL